MKSTEVVCVLENTKDSTGARQTAQYAATGRHGLRPVHWVAGSNTRRRSTKNNAGVMSSDGWNSAEFADLVATD